MRAFLLIGLMILGGIAAAEDAPQVSIDLSTEQCNALGDVVDEITALRIEGKRQRRAIRVLTKGKTAVEERWQPAVPGLAEFVYSLNEDQLANDPGQAWRDACNAA
jgi:hypothetical protein